MHLYRGHWASTSIGKGEGVDEEGNRKWHRNEGVQSKKWCLSHKLIYVLFSVTQSLLLLGFSWSSDNITANNKKNTYKKEPTRASELIRLYLHKNIIIPLLCQCGVFIHVCASKNSIVSKDVIFFWYNVVRWSTHTSKKSSFLSSYILLVKFSELHGEVIK